MEWEFPHCHIPYCKHGGLRLLLPYVQLLPDYPQHVKKEQKYIKSLHETFNQGTLDRLVELKDYYNEHILDIVYGLQILPYSLFDKADMADAIHDLYEGTFDESFYTNYICTRYERYIKKFL